MERIAPRGFRAAGPSLIERAARQGALMRPLQRDAASPLPPPPPSVRPGSMPPFAQAEPVLQPTPATFAPHTPAQTLPVQAPVFQPAPAHTPPAQTAPAQNLDREQLRAGGFLIPGEVPGRLAEEFRLIKRRLLRNISGLAKKGGEDLSDGRDRMVLICSSRPGEGKTFCSINLSLSLASERDTHVLLIDADFAKPSVPGALGLKADLGLLDALADPEIDVESLVIPTDVPGLSVLTAGRPKVHDTEMLASARARAVLGRLVSADPRRVLIFDSAPALAASPASVLALAVGQVVMIVRADRSSDAEIREAVAIVDACPEISLLLNSTSFAGSARKFGAYYGHGRPD